MLTMIKTINKMTRSITLHYINLMSFNTKFIEILQLIPKKITEPSDSLKIEIMWLCIPLVTYQEKVYVL